MQLHVDDDGFVRAPRALVYGRLTDITSWPTWWPGVVCAPATAPETSSSIAGSGQVWDSTWKLGPRGSLDLRLAATRWRHEAGFSLAVSGDLDGRMEWWLEDAVGGTVVHHLLVAEASQPRPLTLLKGYRRRLRQGLWGFKDRLQDEVRAELGMQP